MKTIFKHLNRDNKKQFQRIITPHFAALFHMIYTASITKHTFM